MSTKVFHWIPRVICILAILFISLFALDAFSSANTFWQKSFDFLKHLIPSFVMLVILIIAWKWEKTGGIILTIAGLVLFILTFNLNYIQRQFTLVQSIINVSLICLPFILAGILFIISYIRKKKEL